MNVFNISIALLLCLCAAVSAKPVTPKECESEDCDMPELEDKPDVESRNLLHPKNPSEITGLGVSMLLTMCKGPRAKVDVKVPIGCGLCACGANNTFYCTDIPCPRIELPSPDCHWVRSIENCCGYPVCPPGVEIEYPSDWVPATSSRTRRAASRDSDDVDLEDDFERDLGKDEFDDDDEDDDDDDKDDDDEEEERQEGGDGSDGGEDIPEETEMPEAKLLPDGQFDFDAFNGNNPRAVLTAENLDNSPDALVIDPSKVDISDYGLIRSPQAGHADVLMPNLR